MSNEEGFVFLARTDADVSYDLCACDKCCAIMPERLKLRERNRGVMMDTIAFRSTRMGDP